MINKSEHDIQVEAVCKCKRMLKDHGMSPRLLFAIPNGGYRTGREAGNLKMEGVTKGIPDTCLAVSKGIYHGLYIELKDHKGRLSGDQKTVIPELQEQGYRVEVVRSASEYIRIFEEYMGW